MTEWRMWRWAMVLATGVLASVCARPLPAAAVACPDSGVGRTVLDEAGLRVIAATTSTLQAGDLLLQLNGRRLQTCDDLLAGIREARLNHVAPLFLVRRGGDTVAVVVEWTAPQVAAAAVMASAPSPMPTVAPSTAVPTPPPSPVPTTVPTPPSGAAADPARALLARLIAFGHELQDHQPLPMAQPWAKRVDGLRQEYKAQQARGASVGVVEPVLGYYETVAEILLYKEAATRGRRDLRARSEVVLQYHSDSVVSAWLQRYPFLSPSVIEKPEKTILELEGNGLWAPDRAVALLVEHALAEGNALSGALAAG